MLEHISIQLYLSICNVASQLAPVSSILHLSLFKLYYLSDHAGGDNADSIAMRVRQLYQNDLSMYQRGGCPEGDLQQGTGEGGGTGDNGGGFINKTFGFLTTILICVFIFVLQN